MNAMQETPPKRKVALVIMAKMPAPGQVKTRLIPALDAEGAALLAHQLLVHTLSTVAQTTTFAHIELCMAPAGDDTRLQRLELEPEMQTKLKVTAQGDGDLGARMQGAFERLQQNHEAVMMIGTDAPDITASLLDRAAKDISRYDAIFIPACDGGYTLIGINQTFTPPLSTLFADMPWSTPAVMPITRERLRNLNAHWHEYAPMTDIDEPEDLNRLPTHWPRTWVQGRAS
jgi:rSAM/selenodomain-associated transferase 1